MKKLLSILICVLLGSHAIYAAWATAKVDAYAQPSSYGWVYVSETKVEITNITDWVPSSTGNSVTEGGKSGWSSGTANLYSYAKAQSGYTFAGWSTSINGSIVGTENPRTTQAKTQWALVVYTDQTVEEILYAQFKPIFSVPQNSQSVTLTNDEPSKQININLYNAADFNFDIQRTEGPGTALVTCELIGTIRGSGSETATLKISTQEGVASGDKFTITFTATNNAEAKITVQVQSETKVTFSKPIGGNGSYTIKKGDGTESKTLTHESNDEPVSITGSATYTATASPETGYRFRRWCVKNNETINYFYDPEYTYQPNHQDVFYAEFMADGYARFIILDTDTAKYKYVHLDDALAEAKRQTKNIVAVYKPGFVTAKTHNNTNADAYVNSIGNTDVVNFILPKPESGTYTIPAGITLLVPGIDKGVLTSNTTHNTTTTHSISYAYSLGNAVADNFYEQTTNPLCVCKLDVEKGTTIQVDGNISVYACLTTAQGYTGRPTGYGQIHLNENCTIQVNNNATLHVLGYITGSTNSAVIVNNGARVYEAFQITDWRGGTGMSGGNVINFQYFVTGLGSNKTLIRNDKEVFPIGQYYVQNIETMLQMNYGATGYIFTAVDMGSPYPVTAIFINKLTDGEDQGLFAIDANTTCYKWYDATNDRMKFEIKGAAGTSAKAKLSYIRLDVNVMNIADVPIDSREYVLPINNNIDVTLENVTLQTPYKFAFMAGSSLTVKEDANLLIQNKIYVYDKELNVQPDSSVNGYYGPGNLPIKPITYTAYHGKAPGIRTAEKKRFPTQLEDAKFVINGTMTMEGSGALYTTTYGDAVKADDYTALNLTDKEKEELFGANITSEGGGIMNFFSIGTETTTNQIRQTNTTTGWVTNIPICNAWLRNADGTRSGGDTASLGETYMYSDGKWSIPTANIRSYKGNTFNITLPQDNLAQNVICDVIAHGVTITEWSVTVSGNQFAQNGDYDYDATNKKLTIPVKYTCLKKHNVGFPETGTIAIAITYLDPITQEKKVTNVTIPLSATEDFTPHFTVAINGTTLKSGDSFTSIVGTGVNETTTLPVVITPADNNVALSLASWTDANAATAAPFAFAYGMTNETKLSGASLSYTPIAAGDHTGTLTIKASYKDAGNTTIDSTIVVALGAKVSLKSNDLDFALFPEKIYNDAALTAPFPLFKEGTNNACSSIAFTHSVENIVEIIGTGTAEDPYKVKPKNVGTVTITVKQEPSVSVAGKEISTTITVLSKEDLVASVPLCIDDLTKFNIHTVGGTSVSFNSTNTTRPTIDFNSTTGTSEWMFQFHGVPEKITFTPTGSDIWCVQERSSSTAQWENVNGAVWTELSSGTPVSFSLLPTTRQVRIQYGSMKAEIGTISDLCVEALTLKANVSSFYMPVYVKSGEISEKSIVLTHIESTTPTITLSEGMTYTTTSSDNLGAEGGEPYYQTTVTLQAPSTLAEGTYTFTATQGEKTVTVSVRTFLFPQELPIKLAEDGPERYHFVTTDTRYARWNATNKQIVFENPGTALTRSVTFAFNGAPSIITFDVSEAVVDSVWTIEESVDGVVYNPASIEKRDSLDGNKLTQGLDYRTRYVRVNYNSIYTREITLSNLVIEGYPNVIVNPQNLFFTTDNNVQLLTMIAINLQKVDFELDNATAFQISTDVTIEDGWTNIISTTDATHPAALGLNKVDTIFLWVKWLQPTALDEAKITIRSKYPTDSVLTTIPIMGSDNYLVKEKAQNTGISTGIPSGYTYHKSEYTSYKHHEVNLTNAFAADGTALFDYLFIYGETTPTDGTDITAPQKGSSDGSTNIGSNAVTPLFVYRKALNADNLYKGYQLVQKVENMNVPDKPIVENVIVLDTATVVYINVEDTTLSVYMTGFCPYATTGYTKNQEGVFLFRGTHGSKLDVYLEDFHVFSRNKTRNGNSFYGDKDGGETYSEGYARGSGGVLVFENTDAQEQLQNYTPFEVNVHTIGDNLLSSNYGCFYALKLGAEEAMKAYQVSSPIQVHMFTKDHVRKTKTTLNFDDVWPTAVDANNAIIDSYRTNGFLALKKQANNAPSIDMGNSYTEVNFKGGRVELQNSQIGSDTYKTTLAISYRAGFFGAEETGIQLCHGIGTDAVDGTVNFLDGTITVEKMYVKPDFRQYYLMDTLADGTESEYTTCLRTPKNTFVKGGSVCRVRACQHVTSKGGAPKDTKTGSLLGQYVYTVEESDELHANKLVKSIAFPANIEGLVDYQTARNYTYGLESVTPDANDNLYFWIPEGYGGVTAEKDVYMATWKACMTKIGAGIAGVADGEVGGDTEINFDEEVKYFLYCQLDDNIYNVINAGPTIEGKKTYTYKAPIEVPSAAKEFFNGEYTRWAPNLVGDSKQHQVLSDTSYTIANRVYYITTATADIWQTFTAPFNVQNIYVVETFSETELEKKGTRSEILIEQANHNADFAAFFGVAMAMGTMKDFDGIYDSYIKWAKTQDQDSLLYNPETDGEYTLRGKKQLVPYYGNNWRDANFYLNVNNGNWTSVGDEEFEVQWELLPDTAMEDGILLHKGETYSMLFPYCIGCENSLNERTYWDYWSGKFLIFESTAAPQVINGRDFLNETKSGSVFTDVPSGNQVVVTGNSTFANMDAGGKYIYKYNSYAPDLKNECFESIEIADDKTIYPASSFLYGDVPTNVESNLPARRITRDGKIIYDKSNTNTDVNQGGIPTVGGGNDLFITSTEEGINIAVAEPQQVRVVSSTGWVIYSGMVSQSVDVPLSTTGIYIVSGENEVHKIVY